MLFFLPTSYLSGAGVADLIYWALLLAGVVLFLAFVIRRYLFGWISAAAAAAARLPGKPRGPK